MSQTTFRSGSTYAMRDIAIAIRKGTHAVKAAVKTFAAELIIIGVMAVGIMALKLVQIAVSNPTVANALVNGSLYF